MGDSPLGCPAAKPRAAAGTLFYSTVFAIEQIAHRFPASSIGSFVALPSVAGVPSSIGGIFFTALRTAIRKPRFPRLQLEFFPTNHALFDRKWHNKVMIIDVARALLPWCMQKTGKGNPADELPFGAA